ncbi:DUF1801 domain-containing protein [Phyllobacterium sp. TAF24]|uniref:DUF1801 domain-containing protein n=1 Tax=unclassified Phyllobacterium TaxID=2638441 RepID=UPI00087F2D2B|nr:DUF1801 domain-containing protein [Phyllobacterium sp. OV277]SDO07294.1 hypothetical protein SAMN05443582_101888 [Phyllobacterium sp. OV277]
MAKTVDDYIAGLGGWQAEAVVALRRDILSVEGITETFKWGHPVYESNGPVCLFKAHKSHVAFSLWRGAEMKSLEPKLDESGSFLMASLKLQGPGEIKTAIVRKLVTAGVALNAEKGDPTKEAKRD